MGFRQVDVSEKPVSFRTATAFGRIRLRRETISLIKKGKVEKGDPVSLAEVTGIQAVKKTPDLLALCHPLEVEGTDVRVRLKPEAIEVTVTVSAHEKTGVEMEALTAVSVALLNIWDAVKQYEKDREGQYPTTRIESLRVTGKTKS
ncbi:MAG: cyclic pyranopterin monophosphate synthase MoaC [Nitrososphaerales archaeon]